MEIMVLLLLVLAQEKNLNMFSTTLYEYIDSLHFTVLILPGMLLLSAIIWNYFFNPSSNLTLITVLKGTFNTLIQSLDRKCFP